MAADFEVHKDNRDQWYWTLQADNNETIARSSESYLRQSDCLHSIRLVKQLAPNVSVFIMDGDVKLVGYLP